MNEKPPNTRYRKRNRQVQFDLNRSSPHILHKIHKPNTPKSGAKHNNGEMTEEKLSSDGISDLSQTIIAGGSQAQQKVNIISVDRLAQGTSKQATRTNSQENIQDNIKRLVEQGVSSHMADIKKTMADLATTVSRLSLMVQSTQQENRKLIEANLNEQKANKNAYQPMDISGIQPPSSHSSRDSSVSSLDQISYNRPRIDKWGLEFDGNSSKLTVEDFVFRLERLQAQYGVSWREVLDNFHLLVKGAAEKWYWLFIQTNYVSEWSTLKSALLKQYQAARSSFELMRDMVERKQMPGESIDDFFFAMSQLRSRLNISMPEKEMIKW